LAWFGVVQAKKGGVVLNERPFANILSRLKQAGLRPTRQRLALGRLLFEQGSRHVTAEQLHGEALGACVCVSLATIYNTLHQFTAAGLLREVVVDPGRSYFDTNTSEHHHFYDQAGGLLADIPGDAVSMRCLPAAPAGSVVDRVEIIVRIRRGS
jgi:Fur family iron response transcriptional regulator